MQSFYLGVAFVAALLFRSSSAISTCNTAFVVGSTTGPHGHPIITCIPEATDESSTLTKSTKPSASLGTTNSAGHTVVSLKAGLTTLPTGLTTPLTLTEANGHTTTLLPSNGKSLGTTSVNPKGLTVISDSDGIITLPKGLPKTKLLTTTFPDGHRTTIAISHIEAALASSSSSGDLGTTKIVDGSKTVTIAVPTEPTTIVTDGVTATFGESGSRKGTSLATTSPGSKKTTSPGSNKTTSPGSKKTTSPGSKKTTSPDHNGTGTSTAGTPVVTPPPSGSPGFIPITVPSSGKPEKQIAVTFDSETYVLPHTVSVELLQTDGSFITLFSDSVVSGTATVSVPLVSAATSLSSRGFSLEAGPESLSPPASHGGTGFASLIDALEGLAGSANKIVDTLDKIAEKGVLWSAGSLGTSAFSGDVASLMDTATADLANFVSSMSGTFASHESEIYEMTEDGLRRIFPARTGAVEEFDLLNSLRKLVRGVTGLRNDVVLKVKGYWKQGTAAAAALAAAEEALRNFGSYNWGAEKPHSTSTSSTSTDSNVKGTSTHATATMTEKSASSSSSSSAPTATTTRYMITTKPGTEKSVFYEFIKTLPDEGKGLQVVYEYTPWQTYVTNITAERAAEVRRLPYIDFVTILVDYDSPGFGAIPPPQNITKRVPLGAESWDLRPNSEQHLRLLSQANQRTHPLLEPYAYDARLGQDQTIYILDGGFNTAHEQFRTAFTGGSRSVETHFISNDILLINEQNRAIWGPEDITDHNGHGTAVASVAAGVTFGVASKANLVLVKFRNVTRNPQQPNTGRWRYREMTSLALQTAWGWVINDVIWKRAAGHEGKFIVNMSYGFKPRPDIASPNVVTNEFVMQRVLQQCWDNDIITVVAAGNEGNTGKSLNSVTPQNLGTSNNGLITVGGVYLNGVLDDITQYDAHDGGSLTVYAASRDVVVADYLTTDGSKTETGTSVAAPAVAGLAAYFASLTSLESEWPEHSVATAMKNYITRYAYVRSDNPIPPNLPSSYVRPQADSIIVAYNRALDGLCAAHAPAKRATIRSGNKKKVAKRQNSSGDVSVVVSGTVVATSLWESYCNAPSAATSTHSTSIHTTNTKSILATATHNPTETLATIPTYTLSPVHCFNEADFPNHADVQGDDEQHKSDGFCTGLGSGDYPETSPGHPSPGFISFTQDQSKVNYAFTLTWAPDCQMASPNMTWPTGPPHSITQLSTCTTIMDNNYSKCKNGGVGGYTIVGCLNYTFIGGLGSAPQCKGCKPVKLTYENDSPIPK